MADGDNTDKWVRGLQHMLDDHRGRCPDDGRPDLDVLREIMGRFVAKGIVMRDGERYVLPTFAERPVPGARRPRSP